MIHLFTPEFRRNPYPSYAAMRREQPVCRVEPGGLWAVTRHADVMYALKHPEVFSSAGFRAAFEAPWAGGNPVAGSLLVMDGPEHTKMRALVNHAFTARRIAALEERIIEIAEDHAERLLELGAADFVEAFAVAFPATVIGEILGIDAAHHRKFKTWIDNLMQLTPVEPPPEVADRVRETLREMSGYLMDAVLERRAAPRDDLLSDLLAAEVDGERLSDEQVLSFLYLLLPTGFETTTSLLSNAMLMLTERPADLALLRNNPEKIPAYIDELMRYDAPVHGVMRMTTRDVVLSGVTIPAGQVVVLLIGSANRDESVYVDPDRFDIDRGSQGGIAFGHGAHYCLGAMLARVEGKAGLEALSTRFRAFKRQTDAVDYNVSLTFRGPLELPVHCVSVTASMRSWEMRASWRPAPME